MASTLENKQSRIKKKSMLATLIFFAILGVLFVLFGFVTPLPLPEEEGISVVLGIDESGSGQNFDQIESPSEVTDDNTERQAENSEDDTYQESSDEAPNNQQQSIEESVTQDLEDAPSLEEENPPEESETTSENEERGENTEVSENEEEKKPDEREVDPNTLFNPSEKGKGDDEKQGNEGDREGDKDARDFDGESEGKSGNGISFSLGGRGIAKFPNIEDNSQKQGIVVVEITVDQEGNVVNARPGVRGSTTTDRRLLEIAKKAALETQFDGNANAPQRQIGTITFNFKLR